MPVVQAGSESRRAGWNDRHAPRDHPEQDRLADSAGIHLPQRPPSELRPLGAVRAAFTTALQFPHLFLDL